MHFLSPWRLLLLLAVVVLVGLYILFQILRKQHAVRFTNVGLVDKVARRRPSWRKHLPAVAFLLSLLVLVIVAARPAAEVKVPRERATVVLAMDVSPSMLSGDVSPNRLSAAKTAAKKFLESVPGKINVGLVSFSRSGNIRVPPTTDRAAMRTGIEDLEVDKYTAIGEGIFASLDAVKLAPKPPPGSDKKVPAAIILMSDGESTVGRSNQEAAAAAKGQDVPVSTIAFGTKDGTVTIPPNPFPQTVEPDPEALRQIAEHTGGKFYEATDGSKLADVYEDLGSSIGYVTKYKETTGRWVMVSLGMMLVTALISLALTSRFP